MNRFSSLFGNVVWPALVVCALLQDAAIAQCAVEVSSAGGVPGIAGSVLSMCTWDPDGSGPAPALQVFGGTFAVAGSVAAKNLAAYDPSSGQWYSIGGGVDVPFLGTLAVNALAVLPSGELVVAGNFLNAGGIPVGNIARWDGTQWHEFGNGLGGSCHALAVLGNGDLIAAGEFLIADGTAATRIARWDGSAWHALGSGTDFAVFALAALGTDGVVVGGGFQIAGGVAARGIATWSVSAGWQSIGDIDGGVLAMAWASTGDLIVGGGFFNAGGTPASGIARWDGTSWHSFGSGVGNPVHSITDLGGGSFLIGGLFVSAGGVTSPHLARWDGQAWQATGTNTDGDVTAMMPLANGGALIGGSFRTLGTIGAEGVGTWSPAGFARIGSGPLGCGGIVHDVEQAPNGDIVIGGEFLTVGGIDAARVARWDGSQWHALGSGVDGPVKDLAVAPNGDVIVTGTFTTAGGTAAAGLARWNGSNWLPVGTPLGGAIVHVVVLDNGDVVVLGAFPGGLLRWDGSAWQGLGISPLWFSAIDAALAVGPDGSLYVAAFLTGIPNSRVARWDGNSWQGLAGNLGNVSAIAFDAAGDVYCGGGGQMARRWNGASWDVVGPSGALTSGAVRSLAVLPGGDLLVAGTFLTVAGQPMARLARWDGVAWQEAASGANGDVEKVLRLADGEVALGGAFGGIGNVISARFGWLTTSCPATTIDLGGGCAGVTVTGALPWLGETWTGTGAGLPPQALVAFVFGAAIPALPLASVLPQAQIGCDLHVSPDWIDVGFADANGLTSSHLALPAVPTLVGVEVDHQMIPFELGASGTIVGVTASNAVRLTLGVF